MEPLGHKRVKQDLIKKETGKKNYIKSLNEHNKVGTSLNFRAIFTSIISKQTIPTTGLVKSEYPWDKFEEKLENF